ncbi:aspartyl/asparaginyl beta-hydroxylase domain-containing protein [Amycolatopsis anabasis]|uniref:aspartyl/asparaginyl beta-hydroxylase domain-containing protein n=1 Tax=Amycolatopsis anabasis TaxID=1840409 RepID=UPI00131C4E33|nr:aspartyl/asparaginyl beta-hydroxylase domain-containing protein [Amycolatopsis anabasis]
MNEQPDAVSVLADWADREGIDHRNLERLRDGLGGSGKGGAPRQRPVLLYPGLAAEPWHDPARYEWVRTLERNFARIRDEFLAQYDALADHPESADLATTGNWSAYHFFRLGKRYHENHAACPATSEAIAAVPGIDAAGMAYYSVMAPGTRMKPHCGFSNTRIRCHLGLVVPPGCSMTVGGETREWREGECLVFDDSFEHSVQNTSGRYRSVLLLDTWHPDLTEVERRALTFLTETWLSLGS